MLKKNYTFVIVTLIVILLSCQAMDYKNLYPQIINGTLFLNKNQITKLSHVRLTGPWKFKWNISKDEFLDNHYDASNWESIQVPSHWNKQTHQSYGFAWLKLRIILPEELPLSISLDRSLTAYELYANGKLLMSNGKVSLTKDGALPQQLPKMAVLPLSKEINLDWKISNYHDYHGGPEMAPVIGFTKDSEKMMWRKLFFEILFLGILLMMGIYHLILWIIRSNDRSTLYFALCSILIFLMILSIKYYIARLFPDISYWVYEAQIKMIYINAFIFNVLFVRYVTLLYPEELLSNQFNRISIHFFTGIGIVVTIFVLVTKLSIYTRFINVFQFFTIFLVLWYLNTIRKIMFTRKIEIIFILTGVLLLIILLINDVLYANLIINTRYLIDYGFVVFILIQSIILSIRFAAAYKTADYLSTNLQQEVEIKTLSIIKQQRMIEAQNIELKKIHDEKNNFFINIAHETKTPLTLINNYLEMFIKKNRLTKEIKIVLENVKILKNNITNYLDIEKIEKGKILYQHHSILNVSEYLTNKIILFTETALKKDIEIESDIDDRIYLKIDALALDRLVNNVLDNAIKYTMNGGKINIILKSQNSDTILMIKDTGIGMTEEQVKNIFKPFYQATHFKNNYQGIGIGLSIVKNIIDSIKGEIVIESKKNEGTTIMINLKKHHLKKQDQIEESVQTVSYNAGQIRLKDIHLEEYNKNKYNIFIVEDNINLISYLVDSMNEKYNIYFAINGQEALNKIDTIPKPNLILSDIMMHIMNGYEFYDKLTSIKKYKDIPFIFLTAISALDDKIKGLQKGAIDFISKPFEIDELMVKIDSIIKHRTYNIMKNTFITKKKILKSLKINMQKNEMKIIDDNIKKYKITEREKEVVLLIIKGKEIKEISVELNIAINTVKNHMKNIYRKCQVQNKVELINAVTNIK